jgi:hypothetical protein
MLQDRVQYNTARTRRNSRFVKRQAVCLNLPTGSPRAGAWCQPCSLEGELQGTEQLTKQLQGKLPKSFANSYVNTMRDARLSTLSELSPLVYSHMAFLCLCPASGALDIPYFHSLTINPVHSQGNHSFGPSRTEHRNVLPAAMAPFRRQLVT